MQILGQTNTPQEPIRCEYWCWTIQLYFHHLFLLFILLIGQDSPLFHPFINLAIISISSSCYWAPRWSSMTRLIQSNLKSFKDLYIMNLLRCQIWDHFLIFCILMDPIRRANGIVLFLGDARMRSSEKIFKGTVQFWTHRECIRTRTAFISLHMFNFPLNHLRFVQCTFLGFRKVDQDFSETHIVFYFVLNKCTQSKWHLQPWVYGVPASQIQCHNYNLYQLLIGKEWCLRKLFVSYSRLIWTYFTVTVRCLLLCE